MIVVDNDGHDGTASMVRAEFPDVDLIVSGRNLGATGGRNLGMDRAVTRGFDFAFLVEDDTTCERAALDRGLDAMRADPTAVLVGTSGGSFHRGLVRWGRYRDGAAGVPAGAVECDFVHLDSCLVRLDQAAAVGFLREDFFIMFEEQEFGARLRRSGGRILRVPADVNRGHLGATTSSAGYPWRSYYQSRNHLRFCIDEGSWVHWAGFAARFGRQCLASARRGNWTEARFRLRGALDALRARMGERVVPPPSQAVPR